MGALKAGGFWDTLLLLFTSDNGGPIYDPGSANNWPLKVARLSSSSCSTTATKPPPPPSLAQGGKYADWEGGTRVSALLAALAPRNAI